MEYVGLNKINQDCNWCGFDCGKHRGRLFKLKTGRWIVVHKKCFNDWRNARNMRTNNSKGA